MARGYLHKAQAEEILYSLVDSLVVLRDICVLPGSL